MYEFASLPRYDCTWWMMFTLPQTPLIKPQRKIELRRSAVACEPLCGGASTLAGQSRDTKGRCWSRPSATRCSRVGAPPVSGWFAKWLTNHLFRVTSKWPATRLANHLFRKSDPLLSLPPSACCSCRALPPLPAPPNTDKGASKSSLCRGRREEGRGRRGRRRGEEVNGCLESELSVSIGGRAGIHRDDRIGRSYRRNKLLQRAIVKRRGRVREGDALDIAGRPWGRDFSIFAFLLAVNKVFYYSVLPVKYSGLGAAQSGYPGDIHERLTWSSGPVGS